ncbi:MAG TPA: deoxyribonuclease IV [candidate division WOR-3 bacterium]|uniref:Probable endonuclease 4 n=1 Tax=candidate division WOR-3 bacterium TaxID=2052148 RepID=A0A7V5HNI5_UNCW3|nr:deoxyribonuclease IV [candidate division WOR-3 bacterium]
MGFLGAHVSISGGVYKAPERGEKLGCESIQIFSKNQMQWKAKPITPEDSQKFKEELKKTHIKEVVIHDSYLINLGSPDEEKLKMSRDAFLDEMIRAEILGVKYLVFHPGSHMGKGEELGLKLIAESLNILIDKAKEAPNVLLLLETTAGQGSNLGYKFEHLKFIMDQVEKKERLGVCFDTAHAFEAGYDISTEEGYERTFNEFDNVIGLEKLKVFHLNDSRTPLGSHVDRHEHIGEGMIGLTAFELLVNDERFKNHPMILETPGGEKYYEYNLKVLRGLVRK